MVAGNNFETIHSTMASPTIAAALIVIRATIHTIDHGNTHPTLNAPKSLPFSAWCVTALMMAVYMKIHVLDLAFGKVLDSSF